MTGRLRFDLVPPDRLGPLSLGMSRQEARDVLGCGPDRVLESPDTEYYLSRGLVLSFSDEFLIRIAAVRVEGVAVIYGDVDLLRTSSARVLAFMEKQARLDRIHVAVGVYFYRKLGLSLTKGDPKDPRFESIDIARRHERSKTDGAR